MDQYYNPHESRHTVAEVLRRFDKADVEFMSSIPKIQPFRSLATDEKLFEASSRGTSFDRFLMQVGLLFSGGREGLHDDWSSPQIGGLL